MKSFYNVSTNLNYLVLTAATVIGIRKRSFLIDYEKGYLIYLLFVCCIEIASNIFVELLAYKETAFLYKIYIVGSFSILSLLYTKKLKLPHWLQWSMIALAGTYYISQFFFEMNADLIKAYSTLITIGLIGASLLVEIKKTNRNNRFIFVDACLFSYNIVSVFLFIILSQIQLSDYTFYTIWGVNNLLTGVLYFSFIKNFSQLKKLP